MKTFVQRLLSIGDPRWGRSSDEKPAEAKPDEAGKAQPDTDRPTPSRPQQGRDQRPSAAEPPDLDEVWRDFNRKLSGLFGGKRGSGNGGGPRNPWGKTPSGPNMPSFKASRGVFVVALGVAALLWLASGFYIVQEGQTALILRFGQYQYASGAGFNWRLPYPIESHETVNIAQLRQATVGFRGERSGKKRDSLMLTKDENMIDMQFAVQYRVSRPEDYLFNNVRPDEIVTQAAETAMREVVGRSLSDAVLYENKEAIGREALLIAQRIADRYGAGITLVNLNIQNVQPPEEVQAAFDDAIKAAQDAERLKNEGQAYANDVIPRARGAADRLVEEAEGYRERVTAQAQGDAERFRRVVAEYNKAPAVTRERLYIETMQEIFSNVSKVMVESKSNSNLLYLPLDKIIAQTANQASQTAPAAGAAPAGQPQPSAPSAPAPAAAPEPAKPVPSLRDRFREGR
ncbi:MAG: FtsH protease activity modulator HflK [Betaproteobacteria bacterium]|nr:FtsH protease activity modulator HflK [Betaproteobacteria bacterium]